MNLADDVEGSSGEDEEPNDIGPDVQKNAAKYNVEGTLDQLMVP